MNKLILNEGDFLLNVAAEGKYEAIVATKKEIIVILKEGDL